MKRILGCVVGFAGIILIAGCEWEGVDDSSTWNDSMGWVNFSGTYRSGSSSRPLVSEFSLESGSSGSGGGSGGGTNDARTTATIRDESGGTANPLTTIISGQVGATHVPIVPGTVTIKFSGPSAGTFTDDEGGGLDGTFFLIGPDEPKSGTGSINYDTGEWSLQLESPGLISAATILVSYQYYLPDESTPDVIDEDPDDEEEPATAGGYIYAVEVIQVGNTLTFIDSKGDRYTGYISSVTTPTGDTKGGSSGQVMAMFEVSGTSGGVDVTWIGNFTGDYSAPAEAGDAGTLSDRQISGTWIQPNGTAEIFGYAGTVSTSASTSTTD